MTVFADGRRRPFPAVSEMAADSALERARRGDVRAFADLYDRHASDVYAYLLRQVGDSAVAEELLERVFVELIRDLATGPAGRWPLGARLLAIAGDVTRRSGYLTP